MSSWTRPERVVGFVVGTFLLAACGGGTPAAEPVERSATSTALFGAAGALGDECVVHDDCTTGFCDRTVPGGYCTQPCESSAACGADGHCAFGFCFQTCTTQRDCRSSEFQCFDAGDEVGVCSFDIAAAEPAAPNVGAPCRAVAECRAPEGLEAYCIAEVDLQGNPTGFVGGSCVAVGCEHDSDCGEGARCAPGAMPYCVTACTSDDACRDGYACDPAVGGCIPE